MAPFMIFSLFEDKMTRYKLFPNLVNRMKIASETLCVSHRTQVVGSYECLSAHSLCMYIVYLKNKDCKL